MNRALNSIIHSFINLLNAYYIPGKVWFFLENSIKADPSSWPVILVANYLTMFNATYKIIQKTISTEKWKVATDLCSRYFIWYDVLLCLTGFRFDNRTNLGSPEKSKQFNSGPKKKMLSDARCWGVLRFQLHQVSQNRQQEKRGISNPTIHFLA